MDKLNPGYKFFILLIFSIVVSFKSNSTLNIAVFMICLLALLLTPKANKKTMILSMIPFFIMAMGLFFTGLLYSAPSNVTNNDWGPTSITVTSWENAMQLSTRVLAFGGIGMLFTLTTDSEEFIMSLMQQFKLPPKFAYGILASYHFLPVIKKEYGIVKAALKVRGIQAGFISGKILVPMLVHVFERSENIAMAMESRGFYSEAERTVAFPIEVGVVDYVFIVGSVLLFILIVFI